MKNRRFIITILSIILGLIVGGVVLAVAGYNPIEAYKIMVEGVFGNPKYISYTIIQSTPIILTGISVAFAFNTGLFNIGAEGQFIIGALASALAGFFLDLPTGIHAIISILIGALASALWGGIVGVLKAKKGINEVISSIMLNWIALYFNNYILTFNSFRRPHSDNSHRVLDSARINVLGNWKVSESGQAFLANRPFLKDLLNPPVNYGIILAIIIAVVAWYILKNTTLGYQLKSVGFNKDAAEYGGINIEKNIIRSMMISGAISGIAGATQVLGVTGHVGILALPEQYGFDGMAVSLIGGNSPLGAIPAGLLFGGLKYGGNKLNSSAIKAPSEIINIMIGVIVFFIAMPKLFQMISGLRSDKSRGDKDE